MKEGKGWRSGLIRGRQTDLQEIPTDVRNHNNTQQEITTETEQKKKKNSFSGDCTDNKPEEHAEICN